MSHLRFGKNPINKPYLVTEPEFIACHRQSYVHEYDLLRGIKHGGTFLLNCTWSPEELDEHLPAKLRRQIAEKELNFYIINAAKIASEIGLGGRINMVTQAAFFKLTEIIPVEDAIKYLKESVVTSYGKKGQNIVDMNNAAIDQGVGALVKVDVPADWKNAVDEGNHTVNLVVSLAHPSFKTLHNQSMLKLVTIFLYPHRWLRRRYITCWYC